MRDEVETVTGGQLDVGISKRCLAGELECGDACFVRAGPVSALLAVMDGIGHGPEAAAAAQAAVDVLSGHATAPLPWLMDRCHLAVRELRGLTMGIARIETGESSITWLGVGSVQGVLLHAAGGTAETRESLCVGRGLVGYRLTRLMPMTQPFVEETYCSWQRTAHQGFRRGCHHPVERPGCRGSSDGAVCHRAGRRAGPRRVALARQTVTETSDPIHPRFVRLLRDHVPGGTEHSRHAAYELGREALESGRGVLDVATALVQSTKDLLLEAEDRDACTRIVAALVAVSPEVLSPFEMAHRGAREANAAVRRSAEAREQEMKRHRARDPR